jgi:hypothetical protein
MGEKEKGGWETHLLRDGVRALLLAQLVRGVEGVGGHDYSIRVWFVGS